MVIYFYFKNRYTAHIAAINRMAGELMENLKKALRNAQREHATAARAAAEERPADEAHAEPAH
jgi:hypothetical protein